jgi:SagB-type dehydrogenase family enzyme
MRFERFLTKNEFDAPELPEILEFHDRTELKPHASYELFLRIGAYVHSARGAFEQANNYKTYDGGTITTLPECTETDAFTQTLSQRQSCRSFDKALSEDRTDLDKALSLCTVNRSVNAFDDSDAHKITSRPYPSAGGLFPSEIYVILREKNYWSVCHLDPIAGHLREISRQSDKDKLISAFCSNQPGLMDEAGGLIVLTSLIKRSVAKYGFTGYKFAMMELGTLGHHASLCLSHYGFENLHWGGAIDAKVEQILDIEGLSEIYGHSIWFGHSAKDSA